MGFGSATASESDAMAGGSPVQPSFALTVSGEARAVMTPMLNAKPVPEITAALMRNPITRKAIRLAAAHI
jgi:epsilon-lactone hydrolase